MTLRLAALLTALAALAVWLYVAWHLVASLMAVAGGNNSEIITLVAFSLALAGMTAVFFAMVREFRTTEPAEKKPIPIKLMIEGHTLLRGEQEQKLAVLTKIDKTYPNGKRIPRKLLKYIIAGIGLDSHESVRRAATKVLINASSLVPDFPHIIADIEIVNYLRLRVFEEQSAEIRNLIFDAFGQLYTRIDSPGGPINMEIGEALVRTLTLAFQRETDEAARNAAFEALTKLWCLDLDTSEKIVRDAMNDANETVRDAAKFAVDYAFSDEF